MTGMYRNEWNDLLKQIQDVESSAQKLRLMEVKESAGDLSRKITNYIELETEEQFNEILRAFTKMVVTVRQSLKSNKSETIVQKLTMELIVKAIIESFFHFL